MRMLARLLPFTHAEDTAVLATAQLLTLLKIPVSKSAVEDALMSHPDYPTLFSINDVLNKWGISNTCMEVETDRLDELPIPFIAHMRINQGELVVVTSVSGKIVSYLDHRANKVIEAKKRDFLDTWSGIVLVAESPGKPPVIGDAVNPRLKDWLQESRRRAIPIAGALLFVLYFFRRVSFHEPLTWLLPILLMVNFIGCLITSWLLWYEVDESNPLFEKICSTGKSVNCGAVLRSGQAKVFSWLSWSEIGFFYFAGGTLLQITGEGQPYVITFMSWLNLLALPYTIFSIYFQGRVLKQWCPFCVSVQALLVLEFVLLFFLFWTNPASDIWQIFHALPLQVVVSYALPVLFWMFIKPYIYQATESKGYKYGFRRLKSNSLVMPTLIAAEREVTLDPSGLGIVLGRPDAKNTLIKVCNPYCGPCSKAHKAIERMLDEIPDLKVQIIFTATTAESDIRAKPVKHIMALHELQDERIIREALSDWYLSEEKSYDRFASKYPVNGELAKQVQKLDEMSDWCKQMEIKHTPTFFVNGHQLPELYDITDLDWFLRSE